MKNHTGINSRQTLLSIKQPYQKSLVFQPDTIKHHISRQENNDFLQCLKQSSPKKTIIARHRFEERIEQFLRGRQ